MLKASSCVRWTSPRGIGKWMFGALGRCCKVLKNEDIDLMWYCLMVCGVWYYSWCGVFVLGVKWLELLMVTYTLHIYSTSISTSIIYIYTLHLYSTSILYIILYSTSILYIYTRLQLVICFRLKCSTLAAALYYVMSMKLWRHQKW